MRTTFHLLGAAAVLSTLGLYGCSGFESSGVEVGGAPGSAGDGGDAADIQVHHPGGDTSTETFILHPHRGSTETSQGGSGSTVPPQGGSGGSTETAQGGSGGALQTLTETTETTGSGTAPETSTVTETITPTPTTVPLGSGTETSTGPVTNPPTTNQPGPTTAPSETAPYPGMEDACPGVRYKLSAGEALSVAGTTKDMHDDLQNRCSPISPSNPDVVYQVELQDEATVDATVVGMDFLPVLSVRREACQSERYNDLCIASEDIVAHTQLAMPAGVYWFVVDSSDGRSGSYWIGITAAKPFCGDGVVNPSTEECDPGAGRENDGCFDPGSTSGCRYGEKMDIQQPTP